MWTCGNNLLPWGIVVGLPVALGTVLDAPQQTKFTSFPLELFNPAAPLKHTLLDKRKEAGRLWVHISWNDKTVRKTENTIPFEKKSLSADTDNKCVGFKAAAAALQWGSLKTVNFFFFFSDRAWPNKERVHVLFCSVKALTGYKQVSQIKSPLYTCARQPSPPGAQKPEAGQMRFWKRKTTHERSNTWLGKVSTFLLSVYD